MAPGSLNRWYDKCCMSLWGWFIYCHFHSFLLSFVMLHGLNSSEYTCVHAWRKWWYAATSRPVTAAVTHTWQTDSKIPVQTHFSIQYIHIFFLFAFIWLEKGQNEKAKIHQISSLYVERDEFLNLLEKVRDLKNVPFSIEQVKSRHNYM